MGLELGCRQILNPHLCLPECASTHQSSDLQFPWGQMAEGAHSDTPAPVWFSSDNRDEPGCLETFTWVGFLMSPGPPLDREQALSAPFTLSADLRTSLSPLSYFTG